MRKHFLLKTMLLLCALVVGSGTMWGQRITDYNNIVSGTQYYIGATNSSGTDYYLSLASTVVGTGIAGTAVADKESAQVFEFIGSGDTWAIKINGTNNYLSLSASKANGKVNIVNSSSNWTASNQSGKIRFAINSTYSLQKNNSGTQFGSYANTQTDVWLEVAGPIPTHTATFSVNGTTSTQDFAEGAAITFPTNPADVSGKTFVGWVTTAIDGTTNTKPSFVNTATATMGSSNVTYYAVFAEAEGSSETKQDQLTSSVTGITTSTYANFSNKTVSNGSGAAYAGNCAGSTSYIQFRTSSNTGIVSTTSGGKAKKVTVAWKSTADRALQVYGSNTAYTGLSDIFDDNKKGSLLGTLTYNSDTELSITGNYAYIGIKPDSSKDGASQLSSITIDWETPSIVYTNYCTTVVAAAVEKPVITVAENPFLFSTTVTITCETEGASIKYSYDGETWNDYSEALTITETKTIYAKGVKGDDESSVAQVTATKNQAEPTVTVSGDLTLDLNGETNVSAGTLTAAVTYNNAAVEGATVTWSSSDTDVATIDASTGAVTLLATGEVTFTATFAANSDYAETTGTKTITVFDSKAPGTESNPYTVAEAIAFINTLGTSTSANDVYVSGIISQVDSYNSNYSSITYWISDDGTTTTQMEVYSGKGLDAKDFSSKDDLQVGDIVTVKGKVKMYNSTPEFIQNSQLVSFERPVVTTPSITLSENSINATAEGAEGTITVTYNNFTEVVASVYFCDANGDQATYDWIETSINNDNNVGYVIAANEGEARTAYMKVCALDDNYNSVFSELITVTQAMYVAPVEVSDYIRILSLDKLTDGSKVVIAARYNDDATAYYALKNTTSGKPEGVSFDSTTSEGQEVLPATIADDEDDYFWTVNVTENGYTFTNAAGNKLGYSSSTNFATGGDNTEWTIERSTSEGSAMVSDYTGFVIKNYNNNNRGIAFNGSAFGAYATSNMGGSGYNFFLDIFVQDIPATTAVITLSAACTDGDKVYGTYSSSKAFVVSDDINVSEIGIVDGKLWIEEYETGDVVPANTGVMVSSDTPGDHNVTLSSESGTSVLGDDNMLKPSGDAGISADDMDVADTKFYRLTMHNGTQIGFWWGAENGAAFALAANKAYLAVPNGGSARGLWFNGEDVTAINDVKTSQNTNGNYFDLQGRKVVNPTKGLYIVNGKKVIVK